MTLLSIILILAAPLVGLLIGRLATPMLAGVAPDRRARTTIVVAFSALPWLPFGFICFDGTFRFAFIAAVVLMYFALIVAIKRVTT